MYNIFKHFLFFFLTIEQQFIYYVNEFRYNSTDFLLKYNLNTECYAKQKTRPLLNHINLENASKFQTKTLLNCVTEIISHETCQEYCYLFENDCSFDKRLAYFLKNSSLSIPSEILIQGPKKPLKMMKYFLLSKNHCHIMADSLNKYIGCFYQNRLLVCTFAR